MQNRVFTNQPSASQLVSPRVWAWIISASLACLLAAPVLAQAPLAEPVTILPDALPSAALGSIFEKGLELEGNQRWGEALSHYEEALRQHRGNDRLKLRHDVAKLHYSLDRRYHDRSFRQSISALDRQRALTLFSELLQKTNTHYVKVPAWQQLGKRGVRAVDIALQQREFINSNRVQASAGQIAQLRQEIARISNTRTVASSSELVAMASEVAQQAENRIGLTPSAVVMEFVAAAADGLDDYSAYLTADQLREVYSQIEGNFVGLGVELKAEDGALLIVHVIPGSPAERAGIVANDRIVAVDGKSTSELSTDEAAAMLTGAEGSWVRVTAYTPGQAPRVINVRREHVEVPSMEDVKS